MPTNIADLQLQITSDSSKTVKGLDALSASLSRLKAATRGGVGLNTVSNQLNRFTQAVNELPNPSSKITNLVSALKPLKSIGRTNLNSTLNSLKKLPEINRQLSAMNISNFAHQINRTVEALHPLATAMNKITIGFNSFPTRMQKINAQNDTLLNSNTRTESSFNSLGSVINSMKARLSSYYVGLKQLANRMSGWVTSSTAYIENVNLFTAAMGKYADEAFNYAQKVQNTMGIDISDWVRSERVFMQIATGFGVIQDKAYQMSKGLTQVSYDISSFFNIPIDEAFLKVESGISGEVEPLRRLGYALDTTTLQQIAYTHGIKSNINEMTQAQKSQLRYIAIMDQSKNVMGDMSRTLIAPSNALKIFQQQLAQLCRALGNILIPILIRVTPYAQAFVQVLIDVANRIATRLGLELPKVDYSSLEGLSSGVEDAGSSLDEANESAKQLKRTVAGFDQLNLLSGGAGDSFNSNGSGSGYDLDVDLSQYDYDFLGQLNTQVGTIANKIKEAFADIGDNPAIEALSKSFELLWEKGIKPLGEWIIKHPDAVINFIASLGIALATYQLVNTISKITGFLKGTGGLTDLLGKLAGILTNPWAIAIAAVAGAITLIATSISNAQKDAEKADLAKRFGDIALSMEELEFWAKKLTSSPFTIKLDFFAHENAKVSEMKSQLESIISTLNSYNFRIQLGMDVPYQDYKSAVDAFVESSKEYVQQKQLIAALSIDILLEGTDTGKRLSEFVSSFYGNAYSKIDQLGKDLKQVMSESFVNGEWIPDKLQEVEKLQQEMQIILDGIADTEFTAKLEALKMDFNGTVLTPTSFQELIVKTQSLIDEQMKTAEAVRLNALSVAYESFKADHNEEAYEKAKQEIEAKFNEKKLNLQIQSFQFNLDTLNEAFKLELSKAEGILGSSVKDAFRKGFFTAVSNPDELYKGSIDTLMIGLQDAYRIGLEDIDISTETRRNIDKLVTLLQPTKEDFEKIAAEAVKAGQSVPDEVNRGLTDINKLMAISGSIEAQSYMIGTMLSTDSSFLNMLATSEAAGQNINAETAKGLANSLQLVKDAATGTVIGIQDSVTGGVINATPTLVQNLKDLGVNISTGLLEGATEQAEKDKPKWYEWSFWPWNWFRENNEINSPSELFKRGGAYMSTGWLAGANEQMVSDSATWSLWSLLPWNWFTSTNKISSNTSGLFSQGGQTLMTSLLSGMGGFDGKFGDIFKNAVEAARNIFNKFIEWLNSKMNISWDAFKVAGITIIPSSSFQLFKIPPIPPLFGSGGFPTMGELFIARESGPELVGNMGNRSAVVNNDQIIESVSEGVASAVSRVLSTQQSGNKSSSAPMEIVLKIGETELGRASIKAIKSEQRRTGVVQIPI